MAVIVGDDAGTFLTAMLQRVQAEIGKSGGVGVAPHAEDATFLVNVFEFSRQAKAPFSKQGINYLSTLPIGGYIACCLTANHSQ